MSETRTCLYRFHEPLTRTNWGGRSTSLALAGILEEECGRRISGTIGAEYILRQLGAWDINGGPRAFNSIDQLADQIVNRGDGSRELRELHDRLVSADELVVNGEGDFILTNRVTLVRTLAVMLAAQRLGRPVHLVNSILSYRVGSREVPEHILFEVGRVLENCRTILYRDPESYRVHCELFGNLRASWYPDALFSWASHLDREALAAGAFGASAEGLALPVQRLLAANGDYVVISGSSRGAIDRRQFASDVEELALALRPKGLSVVFASSDDPDRQVAAEIADPSILLVDAAVPLSSALRLLGGAAGFVSGRYHPSVLACLVGTPSVLMESNSHKTESLLEVVSVPQAMEYQSYFEAGWTLAGLVERINDRARNEAVRTSLISASDERGAEARRGYAQELAQ